MTTGAKALLIDMDGVLYQGEQAIPNVQKLGIRGLLVKTGKFRAEDLAQDIQPAAVLDSFADLPTWCDNHAGHVHKAVDL